MRSKNLKISTTDRRPSLHKIRGDVGINRQQQGVFRIALAGAGGSGSRMVTKLCLLDRALRAKSLGRLHVEMFDPDHVSLANVGRSFFYANEVGLSKTQALINRANLGFGLRWRAWPTEYVGQSCEWAVPGMGQMNVPYDFLITCIDTGSARKAIWGSLNEPDVDVTRVPRYWLDLGNERATGNVHLGEFPASRPEWKIEHPDMRRGEALRNTFATIVNHNGLDRLEDDPDERAAQFEEAERDVEANGPATVLIMDALTNSFRLEQLGVDGVRALANSHDEPDMWRRRMTQPRLRTVIEEYPFEFEPDALAADAAEPSCSLSEALDRQRLSINDLVVDCAFELLEKLLITGETGHVGSFINIENGVDIRPVHVPSEELFRDPKGAGEFRKSRECSMAVSGGAR